MKDGDVDLEAQTVKSEELEQVDQALIAVFREKQKQSESRVNAKKSRIERRVFHHLLLFAKRYKTSPILLIMFTPLMLSLWKLFEDVTSDYQRAKNKEGPKEKKGDDGDHAEEAKEERLSKKLRMHTVHGVPLWRLDSKLKQSWSDYISLLDKESKTRNRKQLQHRVVSVKCKNFQAVVAIINAMLANSPKLMVDADRKHNDIKTEWLRDIVYDIVELTAEAPTYEHEMMGVKVLCYLSKIYQLKSCRGDTEHALDALAMWKAMDLDLYSDSDSDSASKPEIVWLFELWWLQLVLFMKQPRRSWYFSREFVDVLLRKNPVIAWRLVHGALQKFSVCRNSWSQTQIFVILGNVSERCLLDDDEDSKAIKCILKAVAQRMVGPLKESLSKSMEPTKRMLIVQNAGKVVRRLNKYKIQGIESEKKQILDALGNSKLLWKKAKKQSKAKYKKTGKSITVNRHKKKRKLSFNKNSKNSKNKKKANPAKKRKLK